MSKKTGIDILAFAPHPDDAELGCGGYLGLAASRGQCVAVADLTQGELGSQGTVQQRAKEAAAASKVLGLSDRFQLKLSDGEISATNIEQLDSVVALIRELRPELVLAPYWESRHPDHSAAAELTIKAVFFAALKNYKPELGVRFQITQLIHYALRRTFRPNFITDISSNYQQKLDAISCFSSQINRAISSKEAAAESKAAANTPADPGPLISTPLAISSIQARDSYYGSLIGVEHGEGFAIRGTLRIDDPLAQFRSAPITGALLFDEPWHG